MYNPFKLKSFRLNDQKSSQSSRSKAAIPKKILKATHSKRLIYTKGLSIQKFLYYMYYSHQKCSSYFINCDFISVKWLNERCGIDTQTVSIREFVIVENIRLFWLLDLTADFGVTAIRQVTHQISAERESKTRVTGVCTQLNFSYIFVIFLMYILYFYKLSPLPLLSSQFDKKGEKYLVNMYTIRSGKRKIFNADMY